MKIRRLLAGLTTLFIAPSLVHGQEYCAEVYAKSIANVSVKTRSSTEYDYVFNTHCELNGEVRKESQQTDLTIAIKVVSLGFSGTRQQALERMQQFCKSHAQERLALSDSFDYERTIVIAAQKSFNECRALELAGVHVSHSVQDPRSVVIRADFDPSKTNVLFRGVVYDPQSGTCTTTGLSQDGARVTITPSTKEASVKPFSVTCERTASTTASGSNKFGRFVAALDTNHGTYTVELPVEEMLGFDLAQENKRRYDEMTATQKALAQQKQHLEERLGGVKADVILFNHGQDGTVPCEGDPNAYAKAVCKGKLFSLKSLGSSGGRRCGYVQYAVACIDTGK
jgi:hypothetical protein